MVLANEPSFRFSFRGNIRRNHPFGNHPFVNTKKGHWEIKGRFPKGWFWRTYPRSGFRSGGTSAKTTLLETTLVRTPEFCPRKQGGSRGLRPDLLILNKGATTSLSLFKPYSSNKASEIKKSENQKMEPQTSRGTTPVQITEI